MTTSPQIISGTSATVTELGKDQAWLQGWLREQPSRLGLGDLTVTDGEPVQDDDGNPAFLASDEEHIFCVDVRLGELEASHGFGVLHNWARNRVRHPDRNHVAVLVTESAGDRYRGTLEALSEHLPLVVVELQVWRGEREVLVVPHIALASTDVDLSAPRTTPAAAAGAAAAATQAGAADVVAAKDAVPAEDASEARPTGVGAANAGADAVTAGTKATVAGSGASTKTAADLDSKQPESEVDTGIDDPWKLPKRDGMAPEPSADRPLTGTAPR